MIVEYSTLVFRGKTRFSNRKRMNKLMAATAKRFKKRVICCLVMRSFIFVFHAKAQRRKAKTQSYSLYVFIALASLREILCLTIIYLPKFANNFFLLLSLNSNSFNLYGSR
jgi:hypothetical protein